MVLHRVDLHTDGSYSGRVIFDAASCCPLFQLTQQLRGELGILLPWSLRAVGGNQQPCTPQWIVSAMRDVVQDLFRHRVNGLVTVKGRDMTDKPLEVFQGIYLLLYI